MDETASIGPNSDTYVLQTEIASNTYEELAMMQIVEGLSQANAISRVLSVYAIAKDAVRSPGAALYSYERPYSDRKEVIRKPAEYINGLPGKHASLSDTVQPIQILIGETTKSFIDKEATPNFMTLIADAMGYYGLIAERLYRGEEVYQKRLLSEPDRIITLGFVFDD